MSAIFPTIAVIVVNWNGWRDTVKAYTSLRRSNYAGWRLMILDNASTDDSPNCFRFGLAPTVVLNCESRDYGTPVQIRGNSLIRFVE